MTASHQAERLQPELTFVARHAKRNCKSPLRDASQINDIPEEPSTAGNAEVRVALRINDAARALSLSRSTIYNLLSDGRMKSVRIGGRRLIPVSELSRLLSEQQ